MKVKGTDNVYALGDCASMQQKKLLQKISVFFEQADLNGDGYLSLDEFHKLIETKQRHYPQLEQYGKKINEMFAEADLDKDQKIRYVR